jgi:sugar phosphate isomerase/epimerase
MSRDVYTYSFQTFHFSPRWGLTVPTAQLIDAAMTAGYTAVGVDWWTAQRLQADGTSLADLRGMLDDAGLACTDLLALTLGPHVDATVDKAGELADMARVLGASVCAAAVVPEVPAADYPGLRTALRRSVDILSDAGVRLALEYLPYSPVQRVDQAAELCAEVGWARMGMLLDPWHTFVNGQLDALRGVTKDEVALVQFTDAVLPLVDDVVVESRERRLLPGQGTLDLKGFVAAVKAIGFDGVISPEILSRQTRDEANPEKFARESLRSTKAYWE